jgi:carbonyl reductase 1
VLDLVLSERIDPALYGELVRFGSVLPWHDGTPPQEPDRLLAS